jgi:hypothetical protein
MEWRTVISDSEFPVWLKDPVLRYLDGREVSLGDYLIALGRTHRIINSSYGTQWVRSVGRRSLDDEIVRVVADPNTDLVDVVFRTSIARSNSIGDYLGEDDIPSRGYVSGQKRPIADLLAALDDLTCLTLAVERARSIMTLGDESIPPHLDEAIKAAADVERFESRESFHLHLESRSRAILREDFNVPLWLVELAHHVRPFEGARGTWWLRSIDDAKVDRSMAMVRRERGR